MSQKSRVKQYKKENLTIHWEPDKCIHSAVCVKTLPKVYDPNAKPWIRPENASIEDLMAQIDKCPSGALSYTLSGVGEPEALAETEVEVMADGPVLIKGKLKITHPSGAIEYKDRTTAFCRCGASDNKPFCDGQHKKIGFRG
jgi:uncharacterized Fe-S cluster protein YjdI